MLEDVFNAIFGRAKFAWRMKSPNPGGFGIAMFTSHSFNFRWFWKGISNNSNGGAVLHPPQMQVIFWMVPFPKTHWIRDVRKPFQFSGEIVVLHLMAALFVQHSPTITSELSIPSAPNTCFRRYQKTLKTLPKSYTLRRLERSTRATRV